MGISIVCDAITIFQRFIIVRIYNYDENEFILMARITTLKSKLFHMNQEIQAYESPRYFYYEWNQEITNNNRKRDFIIIQSELIQEKKKLENNDATLYVKKELKAMVNTLKTIKNGIN